jgi:leucyl aminopeptidase
VDINKTLEQAPGKIAELAHKAEESRFLWKEAEIRLKQVEASKHLSVKAKHPDKTQSDLKAEVESDSEIYEQRLAVISHESEYKKDMIECDKWVNAFASARKLANVKIQEMQSLHDTVTKGGNNER